MNIKTMPSKCIFIFGLACVMALLSGCNSFLNSWFDPTQVGSFTRETTLDIRTSLSIQDTPTGIAGATDPKPEDLIPHYEEYRYGPGDALNVRIFELMARNTETTSQVAIDEIGTVNLPVIGQVRVAGMTNSEITQELKDILRERNIINDAIVIVEPVVRRGLTYVVFGATPAPNLYPLPRPDTRLLEALNTSGGFVDTVTSIYVIRNEHKETPDVIGQAKRQKRGLYAGRRLPNYEVTLSDGIQGGGLQGNEPAPEPAEQEIEQTNRRELIEAIASTDEEGAGQKEPASSPGQTRWIFVNGQWIEAVEESESIPTESTPILEPPSSSVPSEQIPSESVAQIDWDRLAGDQERRVIRISAEALRNGDYRQNIVIRGGDTIRVLAGETGEYYMMGQVMRPGAYSITGRQITLKTAIASAGNMAPLAWPDRCTIYRRYGDREEMHQVNLDAIFAGKEPDVLLKNNDLILVGTHPAAPFLAVFRNAFRFTYGFGFVYDRNFADVDSYGSKINPSNVSSSYGSNFPNLFR